MNPVTMMIVVVCWIRILLMAPSCDAGVQRFCRTHELIVAYISGSMCDEGFVYRARRSANVEDQSKSERMMNVTSPTTTDNNAKDPVHLVAPQEPPPSPRPIQRKGRIGDIFDLLRLCCTRGCKNKDIHAVMCHHE